MHAGIAVRVPSMPQNRRYQYRFHDFSSPRHCSCDSQSCAFPRVKLPLFHLPRRHHPSNPSPRLDPASFSATGIPRFSTLPLALLKNDRTKAKH